MSEKIGKGMKVLCISILVVFLALCLIIKTNYLHEKHLSEAEIKYLYNDGSPDALQQPPFQDSQKVDSYNPVVCGSNDSCDYIVPVEVTVKW